MYRKKSIYNKLKKKEKLVLNEDIQDIFQPAVPAINKKIKTPVKLSN